MPTLKRVVTLRISRESFGSSESPIVTTAVANATPPTYTGEGAFIEGLARGLTRRGRDGEGVHGRP